MSLAVLVFNVDGTLADTEEVHRQAFNAAFKHHALPERWAPDEYRALLQTTGVKERLAAFFAKKRAEVPPPLMASLHAEKTRRFTEALHEGRAPLRPGVRALLDSALAAGLRLGIVSSTSRPNLDALLEAEGVTQHFAVIACGDEVVHPKPAPDVYRLALERLGVSAAHALAFEDSRQGLAAATAAGLRTVVTPSRWTEGDAFEGAALVCASLSGLRLEDLRRLLHP